MYGRRSGGFGGYGGSYGGGYGGGRGYSSRGYSNYASSSSTGYGSSYTTQTRSNKGKAYALSPYTYSGHYQNQQPSRNPQKKSSPSTSQLQYGQSSNYQNNNSSNQQSRQKDSDYYQRRNQNNPNYTRKTEGITTGTLNYQQKQYQNKLQSQYQQRYGQQPQNKKTVNQNINVNKTVQQPQMQPLRRRNGFWRMMRWPLMFLLFRSVRRPHDQTVIVQQVPVPVAGPDAGQAPTPGQRPHDQRHDQRHDQMHRLQPNSNNSDTFNFQQSGHARSQSTGVSDQITPFNTNDFISASSNFASRGSDENGLLESEREIRSGQNISYSSGGGFNEEDSKLDQTNLSTAHKTRNPFVIDNSAFSRNEINSTSGTQMQSNPSLIKHPIPQKQNRVSASARSALAPISEHSIQRRERCVASTPTSTSASASHVNNTPYQLTPQRSLVA